MTDVLPSIEPVPRQAGDHAGVAVHQHLRQLILQGRIPPGTLLNQVGLAVSLGVSPTPLREAIRMLQQEGLVEAEPQKRARVIGFVAGQLESVYVERIFLETFGARLTASEATDDDLAEIERKLAEGRRLTHRSRRLTRRGFEEWQRFNRSLHLAFVARLGPDTLPIVGRLIDRSGHYFLSRVYRLSELYRAGGPAAWPSVDLDWSLADAEHETIAEAFRRRDGDAAAVRLGTHLSRTAFALIAELAPEHDPGVLRAAVATACRESHATGPPVPRVRAAAPARSSGRRG